MPWTPLVHRRYRWQPVLEREQPRAQLHAASWPRSQTEALQEVAQVLPVPLSLCKYRARGLWRRLAVAVRGPVGAGRCGAKGAAASAEAVPGRLRED